MEVKIGEEGLTKTFQRDFPKETKCIYCKGVSRIGFVAHETLYKNHGKEKAVASLHENNGKGDYWLHDCCAVSIYFCKECLKPTALYNQG